MKHIPIISIILVFVVLVGGVAIFSSKDTSNQPQPEVLSLSAPDGHEYFWGAGCPHCAKVEEFLASWEGKEKIKLTKMEIYKDSNNRNLLLSRAKNCGLNQNQIAVPFLVKPDGSCTVGDELIIKYFSTLQDNL